MAKLDGDAMAVLDQLQRMIDISASNLYGLRTQCATNSDLIQQEIRTLEGKLVKLFSRQLVTKQNSEKNSHHDELNLYPRLGQWLQVVGVGPEASKNLVDKCGSLEGLLALSEDKVRAILSSYKNGHEEARRLVSALRHLRVYTERQHEGHKTSTSDIHWESWDKNYSNTNMKKSSVSSLGSSSLTDSEDTMPLSSPGSDTGTDSSSYHKSSTSDMSDISASPRVLRKPSPLLAPETSLRRSKSAEANIGNRVNQGRRSKLSPVIPLSINIPKSASGDIPVDTDDAKSRSSSLSHSSASPRTPTKLSLFGMGHSIKHRFPSKTGIIGAQCEYCKKMVITGVKCKECKYKCHRKCAKKAPPSCGLPKHYEQLFVQTMKRAQQFPTDEMTTGFRRGFPYQSLPMMKTNVKRTNSEPSSISLSVSSHSKLTPNRSHGDLTRLVVDHNHRQREQSPDLPFKSPSSSNFSGDSCSTSSNASSTPPSPVTYPGGMFHDESPCSTGNPPSPSQLDGHFAFPDVRQSNGFIDTESTVSTVTSGDLIDSTSTLVRTESIMSRETTNSNESTLSGGDVPTVESLESQISDVDPENRIWRRSHQRGSLMSEWVIPFEELTIGDQIGCGRFGKVYKGSWHGQVALKMLEIENPTSQQLDAFKEQVTTFRKTRHDNIVLFMGACMDPPKLAIVTSLCKGQSIYQHIHIRKDQFPVNRSTFFASQIAQGMGYLHARGIIHTDLKSKNVFLELNNKVVITDFGLFSVADLSVKQGRSGYVSIPRGWLQYLAPEIVRSLTPYKGGPTLDDFTTSSDVYAFGTVWYELLACSWPFKDSSPETIIWQVGKGMKQSLTELDVPREVKDILSMCWAYDHNSRPHFSVLVKALERLPKKQRLYRSPSQPVSYSSRAEDMIKMPSIL